MKIKTLMAICLFAFSPLALAAHPSCECCEKHQEMTKEDHAKHMEKEEGDNTRTKMCKDHRDSSHETHEMSGKGHEAMKHSGMNHAEHMKAMGKTCSADGDCASMCEEKGHECDKNECKECCKDMHDSDKGHQGH